MPTRRLVRSARRDARAFVSAGIVLLLTVPTLVPGADAEGEAVDTAPTWQSAAGWLIHESSAWTPPQSLAGLLNAFSNQTLPEPPVSSGWDAYFLAFDLSPTAAERDAIRAFQATSPARAALVEALALEVARAQLTRERALAPLASQDAEALTTLIAHLASGRADLVTDEQWALLDAVDLDAMGGAAAGLTEAARRAQGQLDAAAAWDGRYRDAMPPVLLDERARQDPQAVIKGILGDAAPVTTDLPLDVVTLAATLAHGSWNAGVKPEMLPDDLQAPLANLVLARLLADAGEVPEEAVLATLAAQMPRLVRAGYNLTLASEGRQAMLRGEPAPLEGLSTNGTDQVVTLFEDALGPRAEPVNASLVEGLTALHAAAGVPLTTEAAEAAARLAEALGEPHASLVGSLLLAQARFEQDLYPEDPAFARLVALRAQAKPLLEEDGPLTNDDLATLRASLEAEEVFRATLAADLSRIALAAASLAQAGAPASAPTTAPASADDTLLDTGVVLVTGPGASTQDEARYPGGRALVLDLGGDDTYRMPLAGVNATLGFGTGTGPDELRSSIAIDLGGNDDYGATEEYALGGARGTPGAPALGLLVDAAGDDLYHAASRALGWGEDGYGILLDVAGMDAYTLASGTMVSGSATVGTSLGGGILVDLTGNDGYTSESGFVQLLPESRSTLAQAVLLDLAGNDDYTATCAREPDVPCFGTPRPLDDSPALGTAVFIDALGGDTYPRENVDPTATGVSDYSPVLNAVTSGRYVLVTDVSEGAPPAAGPALESDPDGDLVPSGLEQVLNRDPETAEPLVPNVVDSDEDGFADPVESVLGTDPQDAGNYPVGLPRPSDVMPDLGLLQGSSNMLLDIPVVIGIGAPGPNEFKRYYQLQVDLGVGATGTDADTYTNLTAYNGLALDLGGDDTYRPRIGDAATSALAVAGPTRDETTTRGTSSSGVLAALIDLGGNDRYDAGPGSLGAAFFPGLALFLDVGGDDSYLTPGGFSQGYAITDGSAYFLDLGGSDSYVSRTQGIVGTSFMGTGISTGAVGRVAVFLDADGDDTYDTGPSEVRLQDLDTTQGSAVDEFPAAHPYYPRLAAFLDLGGRDEYFILDSASSERADVSRLKENRLRIDPLDHPSATPTLFLDANMSASSPPGDSDADGSSDAVELVGGTDAEERDDTALTGSDFLLHLPRVGLAVDNGGPNQYLAGHDYALLVDQGNDDLYEARAGATSPRFGVSLLLDDGGADTYLAPEPTRLTNYTQRLFWNVEGDLDQAQALGAPADDNYRVIDAHILGAQGAGILGIGVLVDSGGMDRFEANLTLVGCKKCAEPTIVTGAAQGAGLLGVGILSHGGGGAASFTTRIDAEGNAFRPTVARPLAQGAGLLGLGILAKEGPASADEYVLRASAKGGDPFAMTPGQGYGMRGVGILLDSGGANHFVAGDLAQGSGEGAGESPERNTPHRRLEVLTGFPFSLGQGLGALLLPGVGDDFLEARNASQGAGRKGAFGLLFDAEGNDRRTLRPELGTPAEGQGAGVTGGAGLVIDNRGNDRYTIEGRGGQGYGDRGVGALVDAAGADAYGAFLEAQGHATIGESRVDVQSVGAAQLPMPTTSIGMLLDRTGFDTYALLPGARGQGSASHVDSGTPTPAVPEVGVGVGVFLDLSGFDAYDSSPPNRIGEEPLDRNDWRWSVEETIGQYVLRGIGVDNDAASDQFAAASVALGLADMDMRWLDGSSATLPLNDTILLDVSPALQGERQSATPAVDRVELFDGAALLGEAEPDETGASFVLAWNTSDLGEDDLPVVPDGHHILEARIFPRVGTPTAADATDRTVAVDTEPISVAETVAVDNVPVQRGPLLDNVTTTAAGPLPIALRIDRDLEHGCPECIHLDHVESIGNEWDLPAMTNPPLDRVNDVRCVATNCYPTVTAAFAGGKTYLAWTAPSGGEAPMGYRIYRITSGVEELAGYVDARVTPKLLPGGATADSPRYWFVDAEPGEATQYRVVPLREPTSTKVSEARAPAATNLARNVAPGPATGLSAVGAESQVRLVWNAAEGADGYRIRRTSPNLDTVTYQTVSDPFFTDRNFTLLDREYTYTVTATASGKPASPIPSLAVTARPAPGHWVTMRLVENGLLILENASLGGGQTHMLHWDASAVPDGRYVLETNISDGAGRFAVNWTEIVLDGTAPQTRVLLPAFAGGANAVGGTLRIPFNVTDEGTGALRTYLFVKQGDEPWSRMPLVANASAGMATLPAPSDGATLSIVAMSEDAVGNLEHLTTRPPWTPSVEDALAEAIARGAYSRHLVDMTPPGGASGKMNVMVAPGTAVPLRVQAVDATSGIASVRAVVGSANVGLGSAGNGVYAGHWVASGRGEYLVQAVLADRAGNEATVPLGTIFVDPDAPALVDAAVTFSGGRVVGRPGETAQLRVLATDAGTDAADLVVTADVSAVSTLGNVTFTPGAEGAHTASVPINRISVEGAGNVTLRVADLAGNFVTSNLTVRVDGQGAAIGEATYLAGPDYLEVRWNTTSPARGRVDYGISPQLGLRSALSPLGLEHRVNLTGLQPDTVYYLKHVAVSEAGVETVSPMGQVSTTRGLQVAVRTLEGAPATTGTLSLEFEVTRFDGTPSAARVDARLVAPRGAPRSLTSLETPGGPSRLTLDLGSLRDGNYTLYLDASDGDLGGESQPIAIVLDRVAPLVRLPADPVVAVGEPFRLHVEERGSGVDLGSLRWTIGGQICAAHLDGDVLTCTLTRPPGELTPTMSLALPDRAGNVQLVEEKVQMDSDAPVLLAATLTSLDGHRHLRPGATALLRVEVNDLSTDRVVADLRALGGEAEAPLESRGDRLFETTLTVPANVAEGGVNVTLEATDAAGRTAARVATSRVDATPPTLLEGAIVEDAGRDSTTAHLLVVADEDVAVDVRLPGLEGPATATSPLGDASHTLTVRGVRPGVALEAVVTLTDAAGNVRSAVVDMPPLRDLKPPTSVQALRATDLGDGRVALLWEPAADDARVAHYVVTRTPVGGATEILPAVRAPTWTGTAPLGVATVYTVYAVDVGGNAGLAVEATLASHARPIMLNGTVEPPVGGPGLYLFSVELVDASGEAPPVVVRVDGTPYPMTPHRADCREGCRYTALVPVGAESLASGPHRYHFESSSPGFVTRFPQEAEQAGPTVLVQAEPPEIEGLSAAARVPAAGIAFVTATLGLAAIAIWWRRRAV